MSNLRDIISGKLLLGEASKIGGPDGRANSGIEITSPVHLGNASKTNGSFLLWHKSGYEISGITLTSYSQPTGAWILSYYVGNIPADIILPVGDVFDVRIANRAVSVDAIGNYYNDVIKNHGDNYLSVF